MLRILIVALVLASMAVGVGWGEPRSCSVTGRGLNDRFIYPPIARAARLSGVVLGRIEFQFDGKVTDFTPISGPRLLEDLTKVQLTGWTIKTDAMGGEPCQALVIANFEIDDSCPETLDPKISYESGSVLRIEVHAGPTDLLVSISDPPSLHGWQLFRTRVKWRIVRIFKPSRKAE